MENQKNFQPIVSLRTRTEIRKFGGILKPNYPNISEEELYRVIFVASYFDYTNMHNWHRQSLEGTLFDGKIRGIIENWLRGTDLKKWLKHSESNVRNIIVSEYIAKRLAYNDWENEIETEVLAQTENESVFEALPNPRNTDIHEIISDINEIRTTRERLDAEKSYNQIWFTNNRFYIKFWYSLNLKEAVKALPDSKYDGITKFWSIPGHNLKIIKDFALMYNFVFHPKTATYLFGDAKSIEESYKASSDFEVPGLKLELRPYQRAGVSFGHNKKKVLIADEMGLGKTLQAIGIVISHDCFPCLVVCPKGLMYNWENEWKKFTHYSPVVYYKTKHNVELLLNHSKIFITSYEGLKALMPYKSLFKSLIVDESHNIKNDKTIRFKQAFEASIDKEVICLLTGTPIMNRPAELIPQLKVLNMLKDKITEQKFKTRYLGKGNIGGSNLEELNLKLRSSIMIRRMKDEVQKDLPDFTRNYINVDITTREEYDFAEKEFITYLKEIKQMSDRKIKAAMVAEILVRMSILKQISARGKSSDIINFAETCFEEEQKILVFAHHREIISLYKEKLNTSLYIDGSINDPKKRQNMVDIFQNNKNEKSIILSIRAASAGYNLTEASIVIFGEFDWNPAMHEQAEARAHRSGQKNTVNAYYFVGTNTIDETIVSLINSKKQMINKATGSDDTVKVETSLIKDLLKNRYGFDIDEQQVKIEEE